MTMTDQLRQSPEIAEDRVAPIEDALDQIRASLAGLQYGSVNIIVQDGLVIQIDRTEKRRLRTRPLDLPHRR